MRSWLNPGGLRRAPPGNLFKSNLWLSQQQVSRHGAGNKISWLACELVQSKTKSMPLNQKNKNRRVLVAHNVARGHWGGMARMMESLHGALEEFGWETEYFTSDDLPKSLSSRLRRYTFSWFVRRHARRAYLRGEPFDVINIHEPVGTAVMFGRSRIGNPAIVATSHGVEQRYWELRLRKHPPGPEPPSFRTRVLFPILSLRQSRLTLCRADHILCLNEEDRDFLVNRFRIDRQRITRVFPGTSQVFASVAPGRSYDNPCRTILFSGTWTERKGTGQVVEAFLDLAERHPDLELGILGGGVSSSRVLGDFPQALHSRIAVLPPLSHEECAKVLIEHDVFLLPSFFEGTPLALLEAMCTGMPVITTATCGMKDVVEDQKNGLLVSPGDTGQVVRAVERLIADSELRRKLGRQASSDAIGKYTWRGTAELVNEAYASILRN